MKSKRFLLIFFLLSFIVLAINVAVNYKYDLYGVFEKDFSKKRTFITNERYAKINYLLHEGQGKFDTFIFGSSRVQLFDPSIISNKTYNLSYSAGLPHDFLRDLKTLFKNYPGIKKIYIGVDDQQYKRLPEEVNGRLNYIGYGSWWDNCKSENSLLLRFPNKDTVSYMRGNLDAVHAQFNIDTDGRIVSETTQKPVKYWQEYVKDKRFTEPTYLPEKNKRTDKTIAELRDIKALCDKHGAELILFFTPVHVVTYLANDEKNFTDFKQKLVQVAPFYDFCTINFITENNYFWSETSHFRNNVADLILRKLKGETKKVPANFGVLVNAGNIQEHLAKQEQYKKNYLGTEHVQYVP